MRKAMSDPSVDWPAVPGCGAAHSGGVLAIRFAIALLLAPGCATGPGPEQTRSPTGGTGLAVYVAVAPSRDERYCAWYGSQGPDDVLYFGEAAFWSAKAKSGDPTADLEHPGPQLIGRFDLAGERWLPPLDVGAPKSRSGVWDVFAADDGEVYFTTFFEEAGSVAPATGRVRRLALGGALNELAEGPDGTVLATRYGSGTADGGNGDVIAFDHTGHTVRRWSLPAPPGMRVAPKTPLWDALRGELWITTDTLPEAPEPGAPLHAGHEAIFADASGKVHLLPEPPELMFAAKARDGTIYRAERRDRALALQVVPPPGGAKPYRVPLDDAFAHDLDFVQDIQVAADGRVAVTRWSGIVHVLHPDGRVRSVSLPHLDAGGLYYTGVLHADRLCVTYCADVTVVCVDAP
jgi:hypothetical protein